MVAGENNEDLLKSDHVSEDIKRKLKLIKDSKAYFEKVLGVDTGATYEKTILLDRDAVSYLGIRSKINKIKSIKECFPLFGCFPYLGFFDKSEAKLFLSEQPDDISTHLRPVYAYSSLGKYSDRVLSPFFRYSDKKLAELIFHELFHHVFFIKNEVTVNENLATFFARLMVKDFFKNSTDKHEVGEKEKLEVSKLRAKKRILLVEMIKSLNKDKEFRNVKTRLASNAYIKKRVEELNKNIKDECISTALKNCLFIPGQWSAARLSEYSTYQSKQKFFETIYNERFNNLKSFFDYLFLNYKKFKNSSEKKSFIDYLKSR